MWRTRTLSLAVVITMLAATAVLAQTERKQKPADIPPGLLAALQNDLKDDLEETNSCLERKGLSWNEGLRAERLDFDRTHHVWLVQGLGPCLAGNANSPIFLYVRDGDSWRKILYEIGQSLETCEQGYLPCPARKGSKARSTSKRGWPDLEIWRHGSASEGDQLVYRFDGSIYKAVVCNHVAYRNPNGPSHTKPNHSPCLPGWNAFK